MSKYIYRLSGYRAVKEAEIVIGGITVLNGEGQEVIKSAECGWTVKAGDSEELARLVVELSQTDKQILSEKGNKGKEYYDRFFTKERSMKALDNIVELL